MTLIDDLWLEVIMFLNYQSLYQLMITNHQFYRLANHQRPWKQLLSIDFSIHQLNSKELNKIAKTYYQALSLCQCKQNQKLIKALVNINHHVDFKNTPNQETARIIATRYNSEKIVEYLLKLEPNVNIQNKDGNTALMIASLYGYYRIINLLIQ